MSTRRRPGVTKAELTGWPSGTAPSGAAVFAHNELVIEAPAEQLWPWLIEAEAWPRWYVNSSHVRVDGEPSSLHAGALFSWVTFGTHLRSEVVEFEPPRRLGWLWWCRGAYGYHPWKLDDHPLGSRVVTEETQRGSKAVMLSMLLRPALGIAHQHWLTRLAVGAVRGRKLQT